MRHVAGLSGKDSLTAICVIKAHLPEVWEHLEVFTNTTGAEYPETLQWLECVQGFLGKPIKYIDGNLFSSIEKRSSFGDKEKKYFLPSRHARYCTQESKIQPFAEWIGDSQATLYTGIRADESRIGYKDDARITSNFPLHSFNFDISKVWQFVLGLPVQYRPPTFNWAEMHQLCREEWDRQNPLFAGKFDEMLSYPQKVILMSGRSRPNCFFCFNQRQYEVVWLMETHPGLFEVMKSYEKPGYSWIKDFPLSELDPKKRMAIKLKRAKAIVKAITISSFGLAVESDGFESMSSCGLFCGK